jgi:hypothetical protein
MPEFRFEIDEVAAIPAYPEFGSGRSARSERPIFSLLA